MADHEVRIEPGWRPGAIGRITEMHARYYSCEHGFGPVFEAKVAEGLAGLISRLDHPRNGLWCALRGERIVGSIAIDGQDQDDGAAHLRYFVVDDAVRGSGLGHRLLRGALDFADAQGFPLTRLWTFEGLQVARHLYEGEGFLLIRAWRGDQWGSAVVEQVFERMAGR